MATSSCFRITDPRDGKYSEPVPSARPALPAGRALGSTPPGAHRYGSRGTAGPAEPGRARSTSPAATQQSPLRGRRRVCGGRPHTGRSSRHGPVAGPAGAPHRGSSPGALSATPNLRGPIPLADGRSAGPESAVRPGGCAGFPAAPSVCPARLSTGSPSPLRLTDPRDSKCWVSMSPAPLPATFPGDPGLRTCPAAESDANRQASEGPGQRTPRRGPGRAQRWSTGSAHRHRAPSRCTSVKLQGVPGGENRTTSGPGMAARTSSQRGQDQGFADAKSGRRRALQESRKWNSQAEGRRGGNQVKAPCASTDEHRRRRRRDKSRVAAAVKNRDRRTARPAVPMTPGTCRDDADATAANPQSAETWTPSRRAHQDGSQRVGRNQRLAQMNQIREAARGCSEQCTDTRSSASSGRSSKPTQSTS